jgi:hypothetical protein
MTQVVPAADRLRRMADEATVLLARGRSGRIEQSEASHDFE